MRRLGLGNCALNGRRSECLEKLRELQDDSARECDPTTHRETPRLHHRPILVVSLPSILSLQLYHISSPSHSTPHIVVISITAQHLLTNCHQYPSSQWSRYGQLSQTCAWQHPAAHTVPSTSACTHQQHGALHRCHTPPYRGRRQRHPHHQPQMHLIAWQGRGGRLRCCSKPRAPAKRQQSPPAP